MIIVCQNILVIYRQALSENGFKMLLFEDKVNSNRVKIVYAA